MACTFVSLWIAAFAPSHSNVIGTIDSTSGVLINRSFAHHGIIEVMEVTRTSSLRFPGTPAVAGAFDPVQV